MSTKSGQPGLGELLLKHDIQQVDLATGIERSEALISRIVSGEAGASQATINEILAFLSKKLRRRVTYEECFGSPVAAGR